MKKYDLSALSETLSSRHGCVCTFDEPMSRHTTFRIGGPAELFVELGNEDSLRDALIWCYENEVPCFVLGNGSNLLVSDRGIKGVVLHIGAGLSKIEQISDTVIECSAGVRLSTLCTYALERSLSGLEFAYGIPGNCGGAAYMNAGAYGGEMKDVLISCNHLTRSGEKGSLSSDDLGLGYRTSAYASNGYIITSLRLQLARGDREAINEKMKELLSRRKDKQPLDLPNAGSVFKRPEGYFAGALIEQAGLKGFSVGGACVSEKHAGFIVNKGSATCDDVLKLIDEIQKKVLDMFGVTLECEIKRVGE